ncbi:MAG: phosphatidylglycerophosphatase A, partial [Calditrichaeota bacterium]
MKRTAIFLATGAYTGLAPFAPGTAGSIFASIVLLFVTNFSHPLFFLWLCGLFFIGIWAASEAERYYHKDDAPQVVIDEIVGMMVSVALLPAGWKTVLLSLVLFRG